MKKTIKKILAVALSATLAVAAGAMLTACGDEGEKQPAVTGTYMSTNQFRWMNMVPQYNYFTLTFTAEQIQTFDDGTVRLGRG